MYVYLTVKLCNRVLNVPFNDIYQVNRESSHTHAEVHAFKGNHHSAVSSLDQ